LGWVRSAECGADHQRTGSTRTVTAGATKDAAKDKAAQINSKVENYDFRLPSREADYLGWTMADLSDERKS
jgi:hypothetical protein